MLEKYQEPDRDFNLHFCADSFNDLPGNRQGALVPKNPSNIYSGFWACCNCEHHHDLV